MRSSPTTRARRRSATGCARSASRGSSAWRPRFPRPLSIIDIGGTNEFWEQRGWAEREGVTITTVNLTAQERRFDNVIPTVGDATDLSHFADGEFDLAFSNSVIEHLFTFESQQRMAAEVSRVARAYWVQTPNFWFPMEPHFLTPAWHWMPVSLRIAVLRRRGVGWMGRCPDPARRAPRGRGGPADEARRARAAVPRGAAHP